MTTRIVLTLLAIALATDITAAAADPGADLATQVVAVTPDPAHGKILFLKHCSKCHSSHGWGDGPREIPALAGQRESYLIEQLARFVTGERKGSVMHGPVMHEVLQPPDLNRPQAIADLAAYLSRAGRNPQAEHAEGRALAVGKRTYTKVCSACHGNDGAGSDNGTIPAIGGQHYPYLLAQLRGFASGLRDHPLGADSASGLSAEEQRAVADYVSRLVYLSDVRSNADAAAPRSD
jgi:cytochrome c553